jgi:pimeloyl-ACP methyl ester carboxylesterase
MRVWTGIALALLAEIIAALLVTAHATREVRVRRVRLDAERQIAETRHGPIAYASWGEGPVVLVVHGAGGGFDQGRLIAEALGGDGFRFIAPSRFGYLGSPMPADASTAAQADALAELLDHLGVERAVVLGFSGGVPPALQLAARHPDRVAALAALSSAPFTPHAPDVQERPVPDWLYQALFGSDAVYWTLSKIIPGRLSAAFDARPELRAGLSAEEKQFVDRLVEGFLPASERRAGVRNEGAAIDPAAVYDLERIAAPTFVAHARDDRINPLAVGEAIAARVPGAELVAFDTGGHLLLGRHAAVRARFAALAAAAEAMRLER